MDKEREWEGEMKGKKRKGRKGEQRIKKKREKRKRNEKIKEGQFRHFTTQSNK
jgi:hypothetical protein